MSQITDFFTSNPGSSSGGLSWSVATVDTIAVGSAGYMFDNSTAAHTLTLPNSPTVGSTVGYKDLNGSFGTFPLTINGGGAKIQGYVDTMLIDTKDAYGILTYSGATQGWLLTSSSPSNPVVGKPMMHMQQQLGQGTVGSASVAGTQTRVLNTVLVNDIAGASLSGNQITLPAGIYYIDGRGTLGANTSSTKTRLYNVTDSSYILEGTSDPNAYISSVLTGQIILSSSKILEFRQYTQSAVAGGMGNPVSQGIEVYADLKIWKLDSDRNFQTKTFQPINQPITGAYTTGNIFGGELEYVGTTTFNVKAFSCYSDDLSTPLVINSTTLVTLSSPILNTIYHVWAVKYDTGLYGVKTDTDINGANLGITVVEKRWLGFVRTNASVQICRFIMTANSIVFSKGSDNVLSAGIGLTYAVVDHSILLPVNRIEKIAYGARDATSGGGDYVMASDDGTNYIFSAGFTNAVISDIDKNAFGQASGALFPFNPSRLFKVTANAPVDLLCLQIMVRR